MAKLADHQSKRARDNERRTRMPSLNDGFDKLAH